MCDGSPGGFDPADTTGLDAWTKIRCTDSTFAFSASENGEEVTVGADKYSSYCRKVHTFFIRAVDDKGARSKAAYRSFTASTLAPYAVIETPRNPSPGREQSLPSLVRFTWRGEDPIDDPWNIQEPESIRYFLATYTLSIIENLNRHPEDFESRWCPWIPYHAPGDSGTSTVIGDDELIVKGFGYVFVVQAKDEAGAVTSVFDASQNVRIFRVFNPPGPLLKVKERNLGTYTLHRRQEQDRDLPRSRRLHARFRLVRRRVEPTAPRSARTGTDGTSRISPTRTNGTCSLRRSSSRRRSCRSAPESIRSSSKRRTTWARRRSPSSK